MSTDIITKVGIDPGKAGGIAVIGQHVDAKDKYKILSVHKMPSIKDGVSVEIDEYTLFDILSSTYIDGSITDTIIEKVWGMPGQNSVSIFNFGDARGILRGSLGAIRPKVVFRYSAAVTWKRAAGTYGKDKSASIPKCEEVFSNFSEFKDKMKEGIPDALLIARFG